MIDQISDWWPVAERCFCRTAGIKKPLPQTVQVCGNLFVCIAIIWLRNDDDWLNFEPHSWHWYGFSPVCVNIWRWRCDFVLKLLPNVQKQRWINNIIIIGGKWLTVTTMWTMKFSTNTIGTKRYTIDYRNEWYSWFSISFSFSFHRFIITGANNFGDGTTEGIR